MLKTYKDFMNSFAMRAWSAIFAITMMAFLSALSSGFLAWTSQDDANAINMAGSIRMAIMRINYQLSTGLAQEHNLGSDIFLDNPHADSYEDLLELHEVRNTQHSVQTQKNMLAVINDMNARFAQLSTYEDSNNYGFTVLNDDVIAEDLREIKKEWQQLIPVVLENKPKEFASASSFFLTHAHELVAALQTRNEARQNILQQVQTLALILTLIIMLFGMKELKHKALTPLKLLIRANKEFEQGNLNKRLNLHGYNELNQLGNAFNDMAETIANNHTTLADKIAEKTQHLKQTNDALTLFYEFSQHLTIDDVTVDQLNELINDFSKLLTGYHFMLCLTKNLSDTSLNKTSISINDSGLLKVCDSDCNNCPNIRQKQTTVYKLQHQNTVYGELLVHHNSPVHTEKDNQLNTAVHTQQHEIDMLNILVNLISTGLSLRKQRQQSNQLILLEERTTIARELHDSLAQSLSYLKIQLSLLERQIKITQQTPQQTPQQEITACEHITNTISETNILHQDFHTLNQDAIQKTNKVIAHIKEGLDSAYSQLRELLVTFRLNLNAETFDDALLSAIKEFSQKGSFETDINNRVSSENLTAQEQINLLQIVRESLSNVHRHAQATHVNFDLVYNSSNHEVTMTIADNGVGLNNNFDTTQHHGLVILRERASQLGGTIEFLAHKPAGTLVKICFLPQFLR